MEGPGRRRAREERGAAALEFALVVPFLLLIVFGIISFGFMLGFRQSLSQAATEGARAAAVQLDPSARTADATAAVTDALAGVGVTCTSGVLFRDATAAGTCAVGTATACAGAPAHNCVTVTLTYRYAANPAVPSLPGVGAAMPDELTYAATVRVS
ncbi:MULTISPECIES: TadE family protein [unclassified Nocardioides]|uniref:TadE family protein n=1 Tax=unclassified Nocardioides TaxID=2615069 RepID=UPI0030143E43